ncbi:cyclin-T1-like isoform X2 [Mercenaria mercenaria]|nr:cyclin-T1-like isoform X2 [Mercenaria mercenaria]XP_053408816.1 cyclin-T1-like isoform X2 [Mercenaria mercenaria]
MTTLCLQYRPTVVACVCIYMACRWANYKIPRSNEGREWFQYIDPKVTLPLIEELYNDFLNILNKSPMKLKKKIMGWKGNEGQAREEDRPGQSSSQPESSRPSTSSHTSSKHTNHDRRDGPELNRHAHPEQKPSHEKDVRIEHKKEHYQEKRPSDQKSGSSSHHPDRKPQPTHHQDPKHVKREERREGHSHTQPHRKEAQHHTPTEHRDKNLPHERHKDSSQVKKDVNVNGRTHSSSSAVQSAKPHHEVIKTENKDSPGVKPEQTAQPPVSVSSNISHSQAPLGMQHKSKTAIDFNQYVKRREQERLEKEKQIEREKLIERHEREKQHEREKLEKYEREKLLKHRASEADLLNKTFSEGSTREQTKHRPPKLDVSLPLPHVDHKHSMNNKDKSERPYNVNIKSPIKPHHNITVKSPIKSSDLKQPKLELPKVQITPEKDGGDPFSVNINTDPAIRKLIGNDKQDSGMVNSQFEDSLDLLATEPQINQESSDIVNEINTEKEIKEEPEDLEPGEIFEPDITLNPEHSVAPDFKIKELNYDPEHSMESAAVLRLAIKQESNSAEPGSGSNTPLKLKIPSQSVSSGNSPLKIKISTKGISTDSDHSSGKHSSPHRHKHKHKDKHKSHKHSRDKERHREKHREKHSSSSSVAETNGQSSSLKMSIKLSDIQGHTGTSSEHWSVKNKHDKHKHRASISDPSLNKSNNALEPDRSQPWSMSDLITKSGSSGARSPSRKRRRTPTVDQSVEQSSHTKAAKMGSQRIRRSSSSHSVVSMELSDGEESQVNGPQEQNTLNLLNINLMQAIAQTKQKVESLQRSQSARNSPREPKPPVNRQQSGFDLEGMMWAGSGTGDAPPLPTSHPAPPPPPPDKKPRPKIS